MQTMYARYTYVCKLNSWNINFEPLQFLKPLHKFKWLLFGAKIPTCWVASNETQQCIYFELDWRLWFVFMRPRQEANLPPLALAAKRRRQRWSYIVKERGHVSSVAAHFGFHSCGASANEPLSWFWVLFMALGWSYLCFVSKTFCCGIN